MSEDSSADPDIQAQIAEMRAEMREMRAGLARLGERVEAVEADLYALDKWLVGLSQAIGGAGTVLTSFERYAGPPEFRFSWDVAPADSATAETNSDGAAEEPAGDEP